MVELELVGLHEDGEHLVLAGADGQRFLLRIDEPLRAAARRDRPQLEQLRVEQSGHLTPRQIQARVRAGLSAEQVAEEAGVPVDHVRRFDGPVLAEREFAAEQARATRVGRDAGAPVLGDLVLDRLAARAVDTGTLEWDAYREGSGPWTVVARFLVEDDLREALWSFDLPRRSLEALEDEARWLSETEIADEPVPRRHLAAVRDVVFDIEHDPGHAPRAIRNGEPDDDVDTAEPEEVTEADRTHALLDDLQGRRGVRQELDLEAEEPDFEGFGPQHAFDFSATGLGARADQDGDEEPLYGAHPAASDVDSTRDARVLTMPDAASRSPRSALSAPSPASAPVGTTDPPSPQPGAQPPAQSQAPTAPDDTPPPLAERPRGRRGRASVPSWDEIVFGAKPE